MPGAATISPDRPARGWLVRRLTGWEPGARTKRVAWTVLGAGAALLLVVFLYLGSVWQREIHRLMGQQVSSRYHWVMILVGAVLVLVVVVALARLLRTFARFVARVLGRWIPAPAARLTGAATAVLLVLALVQGVMYRAGIDAANSSFKTINRETTAGVAAPSSAARSGGLGSLVSWSSLGRKGRDFVAGAPTVAELRAFSGRPAVEPIRVYAGLESASSPQEQAELVVAELERTGAFSRRVLCVITTTGTGWVDQHGVDPLEYMYNGDTALAAMQYSYLPSWISFLVDKSKAKTAGRELFNQVYAKWSRLPAHRRPRLLVFGESLGSFGGEAAFSGTDDIRNRTDGVLWVGPPSSNSLWSEFIQHRDRGSPEILPTYQHGTTVRFAAQPTDLDRPSSPWPSPRLVYLQHASDPVTWWSPELLLREPTWLREPKGRDVLPDMRWYPFVTFWQVSADMAYATAVPAGHGHNYGSEEVDAWADIAPPAGWTPEKTARLRSIIGD